DARVGDGRAPTALEHLPRRHEFRRSARAASGRDRSEPGWFIGPPRGCAWLRDARQRAPWPDRNRASVCAARRAAAPEVSVRSPVRTAALMLARRSIDSAVILD